MAQRLNNLRVKIVAWSFVPAAIILTAVALLTFESYQEVTERLVIDRNEELTRLLANQLSTEMYRFAEPLEIEARNAHIYHGIADEQYAELIAARYRLTVFDGGVVILDTTGTVVASDPPRPEIIGQDWSDHTYFREILHTSQPTFSNLEADGPDGAGVIAIAVPITGEQGELRGALVGMFRSNARSISSFYGNIVRLRLAGSGRAYLLDENGRVIYHSNTNLIGEDLSGTSVVEQALAGGTDAIRSENAEGDDIVASYAPVPRTTWRLVKEEPWDELIGATLGFRRFLLMLLGLGLLIPAVVVAIGVRRITTPLEELIQAAREVAEGNFGRKIIAHTGDELETLARQFNRMSAQLEDSVSNLEQRVASRTRELEILNAVATTVSQSLNLDELMDDTLEKVLEVSSFEAGAIFLKNPATGDLELAYHHGLSDHFRQTIGKGQISAEVAETGEMQMFDDLRLTDKRQSLALSEGFRSVASAPLFAKGQVQGVLTIARRKVHHFTPQDRDILNAIGNQIGVAIENARLYEQAQHVATLEERQRIARELHDAVSQTLFASSMLAEVLPRLWEKNREEGERRLLELRELTRGAQAEMRTLLLELRPATLLETDMDDLLKQLAEAVIGRARVAANLEIQGTCPLPDDVKLAMYRITQEALNNIAKHAGATRIDIRLDCQPDGITLSIRDDGRGFDPQAVPVGRLGLGIMSERAREIGAEMSVETIPGEGTRIEVTWARPVAEPAAEAQSEPSS